MKHFTPAEMKPSEKTLAVIRQMAYSYTFLVKSGLPKSYCLN